MMTTAARRYNRGLWLLELFSLNRLRKALLKDAVGEVLEIGIGTGANLPLYDRVTRITGIDVHMGRLAGVSQRHATNPVMVSCANAHHLPFLDDCFDTVVSTLVFCSISNPAQALAEIRRVLRANGCVYLLEHVRGQGPISRRLTDWLHPLWFALQGECHLNREVMMSLRSADFEITRVSLHGWGILQMIQASPQ